LAIIIAPYEQGHRAHVLALSLKCWAPVFDALEPAVPHYVYRAFYPHGWERRQSDDIAGFLDTEGDRAMVAIDGGAVVGWVGIRLHDEDRMGEIYIIAVDPDRQREGIASALINWAYGTMRDVGMAIVMVETGDDPGHAPSRATYEAQGFERWPVARYFSKL
jgi:GNAT superfamily N-acetyltransferase